MNYAQLINRGEQFTVTEESKRFEGECVWSWQEIEGEIPRRVYPIRIIVQSIRRGGISSRIPLPHSERLRIAKLAMQMLESAENGCKVELWEKE